MKTPRQFYITVTSLAAPKLLQMPPCSRQRLELFQSGCSSRFVNLLLLSNFTLLTFLGFTLKKTFINFFSSVMPLLLLLPYIKKILSLYKCFTNSCQQLPLGLLAVSVILIISFQCFNTPQLCAQSNTENKAKLITRSSCANQKLKKALGMDFLKLSWRSQEIPRADAIPKTS